MESPRLLTGKSFPIAPAATLPLAASAQQFFRIGTGGTAGTNCTVGGMVANAISRPAGASCRTPRSFVAERRRQRVQVDG